MKKSYLSLIVATSLVMPMSASAFKVGDIVVRGGFATVSPDDASSNVFLDDTDLGFNLSVDSNTQLGLTVAYFFADNMNIEVLAATPFKHDVNFGVNDPLGTGNQLGEVTHLPPTVTVNYYLGDNQTTFKPYVGVGFNYTVFFDEEFSAANANAGLANLSLDNSFGLAAQLGADFMLNERWFVNGAIRWIDIDTEATFDLNGTPGSVGSIQIDPWVYSLSIGYRF